MNRRNLMAYTHMQTSNHDKCMKHPTHLLRTAGSLTKQWLKRGGVVRSTPDSSTCPCSLLSVLSKLSTRSLAQMRSCTLVLQHTNELPEFMHMQSFVAAITHQTSVLWNLFDEISPRVGPTSLPRHSRKCSQPRRNISWKWSLR